MQLQLPLFTPDTKLVNSSVGIYERDGLVYYLHNCTPIFCHEKGNMDHYRFIVGSLVVNGLCTSSELSKCLGVSQRNINRYARRYREEGGYGFFNPTDNRGKCHRMSAEKLEQAQHYLDSGMSQQRTGREINVSECTIRYHIKNGNLKKKVRQKQQ